MTYLHHHWKIIVVSTALGFSAAANSAKAPPPAPKTDAELGFVGTSRQEVLLRCERIGLLPLPRPPLQGVNPEASARIEALIMHSLAQAGLDAVGPDTFNAAFSRFDQAMGGIYNPMNGVVRTDVRQSVYDSAAREFVSKEKLDCLAFAAVVETRANVNIAARWDGAVEWMDGQRHDKSPIFSDYWMGNGWLGAISIALQLGTPEYKVLYSSRGGVQLMTYNDPDHGNKTSDFINVPRNKLLLDDQRIERAVAHVTAPLRYSAQEIATGAQNPAINTEAISTAALPVPPAGAVYQEPSPFSIPRDQILAKVHRVVLGKINTAGVPASQEALDRYRGLIHEKLSKLGWEVIDSNNIDDALSTSIKQGNGFYDRHTGAVVPERLRSEFQAAFKAVSLTPAPDAALSVTLLKEPVTQKWANATWHGSSQNAMTLKPAAIRSGLLGGNSDARAGECAVAAATLEVILTDVDGTLLYRARGGVQLLQQLTLALDNKQKLSDLAPTELFTNPNRDQHAVDVVFGPLLLDSSTGETKDTANAKP